MGEMQRVHTFDGNTFMLEKSDLFLSAHRIILRNDI